MSPYSTSQMWQRAGHVTISRNSMWSHDYIAQFHVIISRDITWLYHAIPRDYITRYHVTISRDISSALGVSDGLIIQYRVLIRAEFIKCRTCNLGKLIYCWLYSIITPQPIEKIVFKILMSSVHSWPSVHTISSFLTVPGDSFTGTRSIAARSRSRWRGPGPRRWWSGGPGEGLGRRPRPWTPRRS